MDTTADLPGPDQAAALLREATKTTELVRGNAGWLQASLQLGMGCVTSMYLLAIRSGGMDWVLFGAMMTWIALLLGFHGYFAKVAKAGYAKRWAIYMVIWGIAYIASTFFQTPLVAITCAIVVAVASVVGAFIEVRK